MDHSIDYRLIADAETKIGSLLAELEIKTGALVRRLDIRLVDVTNIASPRKELKTRVVIEMERLPGHDWT